MTGTDPRKYRSETRVLVYIQLKRRDLYGMTRIAAAIAAEDGFSVRLSGKSDFPLAVLAFQPHIVIFDLETQLSAAEVGGWNKSHLMRISCGIVWDSEPASEWDEALWKTRFARILG